MLDKLHPEGWFDGHVSDWIEPKTSKSGACYIGVKIETEEGYVFAALSGSFMTISCLWRNRLFISPNVRVKVRHREVNDSIHLVCEVLWKEAHDAAW